MNDNITSNNITIDDKIFSSKDLKNDPTAEIMDMNSSIETLMDPTILSKYIIEFLEFVDKSDIINLETKSNGEYNQLINSTFEDKLPYSMIKLLSERDKREFNLKKILDMLIMLQKVRSGQENIDDAIDKCKENINETYVYPKFGGKDEFERKINKKIKKNERKHHIIK